MQENRDEPLPRWVWPDLPRWVRPDFPGDNGRYYRAANGVVYYLVPGSCPGCMHDDPRLAPPNCLKCALKRARKEENK